MKEKDSLDKTKNQKNKYKINFVHTVQYSTDDVIKNTDSHLGIVESFVKALEKVMTKQVYKNLFDIQKKSEQYLNDVYPLHRIRSNNGFYLKEIDGLEKYIDILNSEIDNLENELNSSKDEREYSFISKILDDSKDVKKNAELKTMHITDEFEKYKSKEKAREKSLENKENKNFSSTLQNAKIVDKTLSRVVPNSSYLKTFSKSKDKVFNLYKKFISSDEKYFYDNHYDKMFELLWNLAYEEFDALIQVSILMQKAIKHDSDEIQKMKKAESEYRPYSPDIDLKLIEEIKKHIRKCNQKRAHLAEITDADAIYEFTNIDSK